LSATDAHETPDAGSPARRWPELAFIVAPTTALALGFAFQQSWATRLWPWPDGRLSYIFIGSILAAIAAPVAWIVLSGERAARTPGALNLAVTFGPSGVFLVVLGADRGDGRLLLTGLVFLLGAAWSASIVASTRALPLRDPRPMPAPVRGAFVVFALALVVAGTALVLRADHIFPWPLDPNSSVIFGFVFLGAAVYFAYGVLRPSWALACGQLLGFLAYDLVLAVPFARHFADVKADHRTSLIVYSAVLTGSAVLAVYYLFVDRSTRLVLRGHASTASAVDPA
jgi:hypothetical protein